MSLYLDRSDVDQLSVRRRTYLLWPGWAPSSVDPGHLAEAGFYYTGEADEVRCYACRETFAGWKDGDVPLDVHRRRCPSCPLVVALDRRKPPLPSPPSFSSGHIEAGSFQLPADVQPDGGSDDCVDTDTRQVNISSPTAATTTNKPDKLKKHIGKIYFVIYSFI